MATIMGRDRARHRHEVPFKYLAVGVLLFCIIGAYSLQQSTFDVWVMLGFGILGYLFRKVNLPMAPLVLGLILGPAIERSLRTSLEMSAGDFGILVERPLCLGLLIASALVLAASTFSLAPKALRESEGEV